MDEIKTLRGEFHSWGTHKENEEKTAKLLKAIANAAETFCGDLGMLPPRISEGEILYNRFTQFCESLNRKEAIEKMRLGERKQALLDVELQKNGVV